MRKTFLILMLILSTLYAQSQVGIGTTSPDPSAALELESTDKGLLPPRMTFLQKNNITTPAQGLLIFQTDEDSGFYYFNGSTWEKVGSVDAQTLSISGQELSISDGNTINLPDNWSLAGNMNTTSSNFLGTTDSNPLRFRVNDQETMLLKANRTLNVITNAGYNASTSPLLSKANSTLLLTSNTGDRSEAMIAFDVEPAFGARMQEGFLTFKKYQNNGDGTSSSVGSRFIFSLKQNGGPVNNVLTISNNKSVGIDGRLNITDNLIVNSQVGIGTTDPKATLQIEGNPTNTTTVDGVRAPMLSLAQLDAKIAAYGIEQDGVIIYINDVSAGSTVTETANITETGYYHYDAINGVWKTMGATGPQGPIGAAGNDGIDGQDGEDGVGISSTTDNNDGTFTLNFSDDSVFTTADLTGPQGPEGSIDNLASGSILVGDTGNAPTAVSLSGDATLANGGELTISDDAITTNKLQDASVTNAKLDKTNIPLSGFGAAQTDIDLGSNKILFSNVYPTINDLPAASDYHGMFAHVHGTGKAYYAHAGNWVEIANKGELNLAQVLAENNSANNEQIKNLQDPIDAQDAVTKTYVDAISPSPGDNPGDMLYWDGTAWVSIEATQNEGASLQMIDGEPQWVGGTPPPPQVGDFRDGGVVFYVAPTPTDLDGDGTLDQGLVCAVDDQSSGAEWGCSGTPISGADGNGIGSGVDNTSDILADCSQSGIAAKLCDDYTGGGYSDWFLPSKDELNEMYQNKATIDATAGANGGSGIAIAPYWSSTEGNATGAFGFNFNLDFMTNYLKSLTFSVRAVRAF